VELENAWVRALELAWLGFLAGTTPVGAVVVNSAGDVVAEGRGRRYEDDAGNGGLAHCHIAHAEINALALLPPTLHYEDHALLTTLEPCCMCLGAAVQATITRLYFAGRDPYGGASRLVVDTPQARRRPLTVSGPLPRSLGRLAELLHIRFLLDFGAAEPVLAEQRLGVPDIWDIAVSSRADKLFRQLKGDRVNAVDAMAAAGELLSDNVGPTMLLNDLRSTGVWPGALSRGTPE
jgi:tRNA(Arg) A34 adenosine deaminase TadA